jgi:hypothetical protein
MSYGLEVDLIKLANSKDMLTTPYVFNAGEAAAMAKAGADIIVCHLGLTTGGSIGSKTALKLKDCPALVDEWAEAALKVNKDAIVIVHGGPVSMPDDAEFILKNTKNCHGFYGASSMERLPTEVALAGEPLGSRAPRRNAWHKANGEEGLSGRLAGEGPECIDLTTLAGDDTPGRVRASAPRRSGRCAMTSWRPWALRGRTADESAPSASIPPWCPMPSRRWKARAFRSPPSPPAFPQA